jgi:hypothetical protein
VEVQRFVHQAVDSELLRLRSRKEEIDMSVKRGLKASAVIDWLLLCKE